MFALQEAFSMLHGGDQSVLDLATATGMPDSTVHRILQSGLSGGAIDQICRGKYRPGPTIIKIAMHAMAHVPSAATTQRLLTGLHDATGGAALLFALTPFGGLRRLCTDYAWGDLDPGELGVFAHPLVTHSRSLRTGASGRVILAHLPAPLQELVFAEELPADAAPGAIRDNDALAATLTQIRQSGYAVAQEEVVPGWDAIAAPVMWGDIAMGSVLLAKPKADMPADLSKLIEHTRDTARKLSALTAAPTSHI
ncbi:helix-turn-helix domain-containing protein [Kitasatospora aureofaciens]|uniref:IclR family transcriptional regulator n=1 Tax=Kitasatospora aureofaciens TaxID=1894 RepID=UPI001C45B2BA|nr:IclR family transcriptional regulator C-terminal domain-containing protein [Kitasatospora aureofaciens]MBV6695591.1 helix-turn-helix domain-containing protein [Kitasatospora aureofaciens]